MCTFHTGNSEGIRNSKAFSHWVIPVWMKQISYWHAQVTPLLKLSAKTSLNLAKSDWTTQYQTVQSFTLNLWQQKKIFLICQFGIRNRSVHNCMYLFPFFFFFFFFFFLDQHLYNNVGISCNGKNQIHWHTLDNPSHHQLLDLWIKAVCVFPFNGNTDSRVDPESTLGG